MNTRLRFAALCILLAPLARADVIVVDPGGGPGAAQLQAAIDAARSGDILLLRAGDYASATPPTAYGKALIVLADSGQDVTLPGLAIQDLPAGGLYLVRGLRTKPSPGVPGLMTFTIGGPAGLWVEDCEIAGPNAGIDADGLPTGGTLGVTASNLAFAVIERSQLVGGRGRDAGIGPGGLALPATAGAEACWLSGVSTVALGQVTARGGDGGNGLADPGALADGAHAVSVTGAEVEVQGGTYVGGDEGLDNSALTHPGSAFRFLVVPTAGLRDISAQAGAVHGDGTPAPAIWSIFSTVVNRPAPARVLAIDSPVREFGHVGVHVAGQPGDLAWLFLSTAPGGKVLAGKQGLFSLEPGQPVLPVLLGPTDAAGGLDEDGFLPALPPGMDGTVLFGQLMVVNGGSVLLGTASSLVWISASY